MDGIIAGIHPRKIKIRPQSLFTGAVQKRILLRMDGPAELVALPLMKIPFDPGAGADIAAVRLTSGGAIVACGDHHIVFYNDCPVFTFQAGTPIGKSFRYI